MTSQNGKLCAGCRLPIQGLDNSHIIPVSQRKSLEFHPDNTCDHCRKCHDVWEVHNPNEMKKLGNFWPAMKIAKGLDPSWFWGIMNKLDLDALEPEELIRYKTLTNDYE